MGHNEGSNFFFFFLSLSLLTVTFGVTHFCAIPFLNNNSKQWKRGEEEEGGS